MSSQDSQWASWLDSSDLDLIPDEMCIEILWMSKKTTTLQPSFASCRDESFVVCCSDEVVCSLTCCWGAAWVLHLGCQLVDAGLLDRWTDGQSLITVCRISSHYLREFESADGRKTWPVLKKFLGIRCQKNSKSVFVVVKISPSLFLMFSTLLMSGGFDPLTWPFVHWGCWSFCRVTLRIGVLVPGPRRPKLWVPGFLVHVFVDLTRVHLVPTFWLLDSRCLVSGSQVCGFSIRDFESLVSGPLSCPLRNESLISVS